MVRTTVFNPSPTVFPRYVQSISSTMELNIPVIAIGIPTVVEASTIVSNSIEYLFKHISYELDNKDKKSLKFVPTLNRNYKSHKEDLSKEEKEKLLGIVGSLDSDSNKNLMREVLLPLGYNYIVSSKEIDFVVKKMSMLLANSLNNSLLLS